MKRKYLMTPGPSPVPAFVRESLSREIMHHRTDEFREILQHAHEGLKYVFCTKNPVLIFSSSGTGAMEATVSSLFSPGDKVISIAGGKFGQRWTELAKAYQLDVVEMTIDWGNAPDPERLKSLLEQHAAVKGVLTTLCETSTGTVYDVEALAKTARKAGALIVVDAVSGLGQDKLPTDEWGVDAVVSGSQKGLMLPPGLAFVSVNANAQTAMKNAQCSRYYLNLQKALASYAKSDTPFTPAVSLVVGLKEALRTMQEERMESRWVRFETMAAATRKAAQALGLKLFSSRPSASLTAIRAPEGIKSTDIVRTLRKNYGISIAAGQGDVKEKIFRIAHMGWINEQDLMMTFSLLEKVLRSLGHTFENGVSLACLQEVLYGK
ncbi:MAG: aminotransferase class V-fold PLP-dependent enzyme [Candidatus Omnitrophica bacterium]|nr:aminotransferase class V-fold PLP-dependent enzyme [Candidatus Omnitrophota bacterium]